LLGAIFLSAPIHVIDSDTIPIDRSISDHDGTYMYVTIHSGYDHNKSFTRDVWNYKRANYEIHNLQMPMKVSVTFLHAVLISVAL
jgi:hypothetical protein